MKLSKLSSGSEMVFHIGMELARNCYWEMITVLYSKKHGYIPFKDLGSKFSFIQNEDHSKINEMKHPYS